jgi:hypothetical protein
VVLVPGTADLVEVVYLVAEESAVESLARAFCWVFGFGEEEESLAGGCAGRGIDTDSLAPIIDSLRINVESP